MPQGTRDITITVNGAIHQLTVPTDRLLIDVLRIDLGLVGTKLGCEIGVCGLCAVIVDGSVQSSCLLLAILVDGAAIETIEGMAAPDGRLGSVQEAFVRHGGLQCGICTPGQVVTATALLRERPDASPSEIREWMTGSLCRCAAYEGIYNAITSLSASGVAT
jgi:carbon-monoxide dehydrogenase small subunit